MKKNLLAFLVLAVFFINMIKVEALTPTMSSDVSSYPGAGSVPAGAIGSYVNTGYRMYIVSRETGNILAGSRIVDMAVPRNNLSSISFYKTTTKYTKIYLNNQAVAAGGSYKSLIPKSELVQRASNDTIYLNSYRGITFPTNYSSTTLGTDPVNSFHTRLNSQGKSTGDEITDFYDFVIDYLYTGCSATDYACRLAKTKTLSSYKLIDPTKPDTLANRISDYYLIYEPLIFYKIFASGYYALTASEAALFFNTTNFGNWWTGVTVNPEPIYRELAPSEFRNVLNYSSCTTELNNALYNLLYGSGSIDAVDVWNDRCKMTLNWLLNTQNLGRNPRFTVHRNSYRIGSVTYSAYVSDGTETAQYPSRFTPLQVINNTRGLSMGVVSLMSEPKTCNPTLADAANLASGSCCTEFARYLLENTAPEIRANYTRIKTLYDNSPCNKCPMTSPTTEASTTSQLPGNLCCVDVKKWLDNVANRFSPNYASYNSRYTAACTIPIPPQPQACTYSINTKYPDNCSNSTDGYVSDIEDWNCIFKSTTLGGPNFSTHYDELSNRYCKIYCRQDINYEFPNSSFTILAGNHFTVGTSQTGSSATWNPIRMVAEATCKVDDNNINHSLFVTDWNSADARVATAWDNYQIELAKQRSVDNASYTANVSSCDYKYSTTHFDHCITEESYCSTGTPVNGQCRVVVGSPVPSTGGTCLRYGLVTGNCLSCSAGYRPSGKECVSTTANYCATGTLYNGSCVDYNSVDYRCTNNNYTRWGAYYPANSYYPSSGGTNYIQGSWCENEGRPSFNPNSYYNLYTSAISSRDNLLTTLNQCVNYSYTHTFNPPLSMTYEEAKYGGNFPLIGTAQDTTNTIRLDNTFGTVARNSCSSGSRCVSIAGAVSYPTANNIIHTSQRTINYQLATGLYSYIDKITGVSSSIAPPNQYMTLGYSNLPVDYTRVSGTYNIQVNFSNFGPGNKFNEFIMDGKANTTRCDGSPNCCYDCTYNVTNRILCNPLTENCSGGGGALTDLNVVFRPISLSNPFPGQEGSGRTSGSNWIGNTFKISKNRGVNAEEVYTRRDPIYSIILDGNTIRTIRQYNKQNPYTNFNLTCETGTGQKCISSFLTSLKSYNNLKINSCARDASNKWSSSCSYQ